MRATALWVVVVIAGNGAGAQPIVIEGVVPVAGGDFFDVPFDVPEGIREIQVSHAPIDPVDVLDWGLFAPDGFRGYGGGNLEDIVVGESAASRGYLPGPIAAGTWVISVGKARLASASPGYRVAIVLRSEPTLTPALDRTSWREPAPLDRASRFFAGDFHVHSEDSGDADATLDDIAAMAITRALDFVVITDHNTTSHVDRLLSAQDRAGGSLLLVPGVELTTYAGHATGFASTSYVDHRVGFAGNTIEEAVAAISQSGALFSINHPTLDLGSACIGCAWTHPDPEVGTLHGVEIQTGRTLLFTDAAIVFWEELLAAGHHVAALGGSDDHEAGQGSAAIGEPTTLVFAADLSVDSLRIGILHSRTVVKMQGPNDPMIVLDTVPPRNGDTAIGVDVTITATVTGGVGKTFRFIEDGLGVAVPAPITTDPQSFALERTPDASGTKRMRAEVADLDGAPRTLTSYVWLRAPPAGAGCACGSSARASVPGVLAWLALLWHIWRTVRSAARGTRARTPTCAPFVRPRRRSDRPART